MIFSETIDKVLDSTKTQTRRPRKIDDIGEIDICRIANGPRENNTTDLLSVRRSGRLLWEVGRTYAIQPGRSKHSVGRIKITRIRKTILQMISRPDARAEGFKSVKAFNEVWIKLYPADRYKYSIPIYALDFELVKGSNDGHQT